LSGTLPSYLAGDDIMPTGYTAKIADGISFREYALNCARAFGALIMMRDEPFDAPIPKKFEPSDYHAQKLKELEKELTKAKKMTDSEAESEARFEYDKELESHKKYLDDKVKLKEKYLDMLKQVRVWQPPTPEHIEYKNFMISQIEQSIDFDCSTTHCKPPTLKIGRVWLSEKIARLIKDLEYHNEQNLKEIDNANGRSEWVNALHNSLPSK
jgi:hypothetical protein